MGGAAQRTVSPTGAKLGTGIRYIEFVAEDGGLDVYRELNVNGVATELAAWVQLALSPGVLAGVRLRSKDARV